MTTEARIERKINDALRKETKRPRRRTDTHVDIPRRIRHDDIERPEHLEIELPYIAADPACWPASFRRIFRLSFGEIGDARDERA